MTTDEKFEILHDSIKSLENIAAAHQASIEGLATSVTALLAVAEKHDAQIAQTTAAVAALGRQLQAYLTRIPPQ